MDRFKEGPDMRFGVPIEDSEFIFLLERESQQHEAQKIIDNYLELHNKLPSLDYVLEKADPIYLDSTLVKELLENER